LQTNVFALGVTPISRSVCESIIGLPQFGQAIGLAPLREWDLIAFANINAVSGSICENERTPD
jgi:hypothetical protein